MMSLKHCTSFSRRAYSTAAGPCWLPQSKSKYVPENGHYPLGFKVSGTFVGIKPGNITKPDLALIASCTPCTAAAVFTKNKFQAAPVTFSRSLLKQKRNHGLHSILINSGCANAVTGRSGLTDAEAMANKANELLDVHEATLVMSTGVIGQRLPIQKILDKVPQAYQNLGSSHHDWLQCATAICTTDTFPKLISRSFTLPSSPAVEYRIAGISKGAGMIQPNMATLLGAITTDVPISDTAIAGLLKGAVNKSFNSITIDGDTSTNDTVALLANGAAGGPEIMSEGSPDYYVFQKVLEGVSTELAQLVVRDGEGASKFVTITVTESASEEGARKIASTIARSPLVKTALYGMDANWGRILCAVGYALISEPGTQGHDVADINPSRTTVTLVAQDGGLSVKLLINGEPESLDEQRAAEILRQGDIEIVVQLGTGKEEAKHWTCDLSHDFVSVNADYRS